MRVCVCARERGEGSRPRKTNEGSRPRSSLITGLCGEAALQALTLTNRSTHRAASYGCSPATLSVKARHAPWP